DLLVHRGPHVLSIACLRRQKDLPVCRFDRCTAPDSTLNIRKYSFRHSGMQDPHSSILPTKTRNTSRRDSSIRSLHPVPSLCSDIASVAPQLHSQSRYGHLCRKGDTPRTRLSPHDHPPPDRPSGGGSCTDIGTGCSALRSVHPVANSRISLKT